MVELTGYCRIRYSITPLIVAGFITVARKKNLDHVQIYGHHVYGNVYGRQKQNHYHPLNLEGSETYCEEKNQKTEESRRSPQRLVRLQRRTTATIISAQRPAKTK